MLDAGTLALFLLALLALLLSPGPNMALVLLPHFVDPARGSLPLRLVRLGVMLSLAGLVFNTLRGACGGQPAKGI